jgi:hypothetical protein
LQDFGIRAELAPENDQVARSSAIASPQVRSFAILVVLAVTAAIVFHHYIDFLRNPRPLWNSLVHDRNGHYHFALLMALALRRGELLRFIGMAIGQSKIWPPVHGVLTALVITPWGPDYRVAVLTSLLGWGMAAVFAFLIAAKISTHADNAAGVVAAALVLASPAYRDYSTDIMLESLGAGLTMMALYLYVAARQEPSRRAWRRFSIALTILFFEKYNYWALVAIALGAVEILRSPGFYFDRLRVIAGKLDRKAVAREFTRPLIPITVLMLVLMAVIWTRGPRPVMVGRFRITVYPPRDELTAAFAALALRALMAAPLGWWRKLRLSACGWAQLTVWHVMPIAVSFLLPGRLWMFLWYLGPFNHFDIVPAHGIAWAIAYYGRAAVFAYHCAPWIACIVAAAFLVSLVQCRNWRPGGSAIVLFAAISAVTVIVHPNQQDRFIFSWFAAVWVASAVAMVSVIYQAQPILPAGVCNLIAGGVAAGALVILISYAARPWTFGSLRSDLDISDTYLPALKPFKHVVFLSNMPLGAFVQWTFLEHYPHLERIEWPLKGGDFTPAMAAQSFANLAASGTAGDAIIFIEVPPQSPDYMALSDDAPWARLYEQERADRRLLSRTWQVPGHGVRVTLWTRARNKK